MLKLFNTLSRKVEEFKPLNPPKVTLYTCGPTVYSNAHIGHIFKYINDDLLKRVLETNGYELKHVMNITDVGHLTSDEDSGEDKMEKGARESGRTVWEVAKFYEEDFWEAIDSVNISRPDVVARATEHVKEQIKLIERLEKNGFVYQTDNAIYFDLSKFPDYTKLSRQKLEDKEIGVRDEVIVDKQKKSPHDFALWFFTVGHYENHTMRWPSPWGEGFPGWHIECSAMSMLYLGDTIDIHTGGIDHIPVHHTNEIAQSEAATGEKFVNYWVHHGWVLVDGEKMSKSKKNFYTIDDILEKGFDPLALRYLFLTSHHRSNLNFTWDSLQGAQNALNNLRREIRGWEVPNGLPGEPKGDTGEFWQRFMEAANNDLNTPQAVAVMWEMIGKGDTISSISQVLLMMDKILGLELDKILGKSKEIPENIQKLLEKRENARKNKDFEESDRLRKEIQDAGYELEDTPTGQKIK